MTNRNIKEISKRTYQIFIGIFLCLLSISLCINAGYAAKAISFSFAYVLGAESYLIYGFVFLEGISLAFRGKGISIKFNRYLFYFFILLVGIAGLFTCFTVNQKAKMISFISSKESINFAEKLKQCFTNYLANKDPIYLLGNNTEYGCGLFGYAVIATCNSAFSSIIGGGLISIVLTLLGAILIIIPAVSQIILFFKKRAEIKAAKKANDPNYFERIKNLNVVKDAKRINPKTYHSEVSGAGRNLKDFDEKLIENPDSPTLPLRETVLSDDEDGLEIESLDEFRKPVFDLDDVAPKFTKKEEPVIEENFGPIGENPTFDDEDIASVDIARSREIQPVRQNNEPLRNTFVQSPRETYVKPSREVMPQQNREPVNRVQPMNQPVVQQNVQPVSQTPVVMQNTNSGNPSQNSNRVDFQVIGSDILETYDTTRAREMNAAIALDRKETINNTFKDFGVGAEVMDYTIGPSVTRYNIRYNSNVSSRAVANLVQDISIRLNGVCARFESIIEGQSTSGLEIPNAEITTVAFKDVYEALPDPKTHPLAVAFGKNIKGSVIYADYDEFPHMLISGTTGSGKSVFVNSIICTLIMRNSPDDLKLVLVDPKKVEMSRYADMPHLLTPIITEPLKVKLVLDKLVDEMEYRYNLFSKNNATNIKEYNEDCEFNGNEKIPYIVVVLDEYADLVEQCKEISFPVVMLAQKARACGIHIMLSTQRPSTNVVTGVIKANMPTHVALMTANYVDSTTIIGEGGAEKLMGKGDMLVQSPLVSRVGVCRLQSCFINRREIIRIVTELKNRYPTKFDSNFLNLEEQKPSEYASADLPEPGESDEETKYRSIRDWVMSQEYMSMSKIQRDCGVGFNRAGRFFNRLQQEGIVAPESEGSKGCRVLMQNKFGDIDDDDVIATSEDNSYIK